MNGIRINIDPIIAQVGAFELRWYSLAIMVAVLSAVLITAQQGKKRGIATEDIYSLAIWVIAAGIIGARLFHVIDQFGYYASHPAQILAFQQGGLAIYGALVGGGVAATIYARVKHMPPGRLFDALAPAVLTAQIIGRIGCVVNGDAYGGITSLPWAFIYVHPNAMIPAGLFGVPTHPYPLYEMIWDGIALMVIFRLGRSLKRDGILFLTYASLYSLGRFVLTFVREEKIVLWGLQQAQVIALAGLAASLMVMMYMYVRHPVRQNPAESQNS